MSWLIILAIAVISDALRIFIDNYVSDVYFKEKGAVSQKIVSGIVTPILGIIILIFTGFSFTEIPPIALALLLMSGVLSSVAGIPYYKALEIDDSTNIGIFFQFSPILYLIIGWIIGDEQFSIIQLLACFIILAAPLLVVITAKKRSRKVRIKAALLAFISIIFYVASGETFIQGNVDGINIFSEIGLVLITKGLSDLLIIGSRRKLRRRLAKVVKSSRRKVLFPINISIVMRVIQEFSYRIGLIIAPSVAIASAASDAVEPAVIFFMGLLLTILWPKFGREKLQKKTVLVHFIATVLVVIGIVILRI
jgi:drug/metabolite transporter (DMT)-like permease